MQLQLRRDGVASETHQCLWWCLQTDRQLTLMKELNPNFKISGAVIGFLINRSRFADSNTNESSDRNHRSESLLQSKQHLYQYFINGVILV